MATKVGNIKGPTGATGPQGSTGPTGPQGPIGLNSFNVTSGSFTVPAVGSTVTVTLNDASWVVVGQMVYVDQAGGGVGQAGALQVTAKTGNQITLLNPTPAPAIPLASSSASGLMNQTSGNTTDFVDGTNNCQNLVNATQPTIWSVRLRSFNAVGNPNFSVQQRNCGAALPSIINGAFIEDRWSLGASASMSGKLAAGAVNASVAPGAGFKIPGTSFAISNSAMSFQVGTAIPSLAASDLLTLSQTIEGPFWRELMSDVHSVSILCQSSVANLKFGLALRDNAAVRSLTKLCTLGAANTSTLITLPNLPLWDSGGTYSVSPGAIGYYLTICLAGGSTYVSPANDTWQAGNFVGAAGQSNFMATAGATFNVICVQHEPGSVCTTLMDLPFSQNLHECQRYYQKSYNYGVKAGTASSQSYSRFVAISSVSSSTYTIYGNVRFSRRLAKVPTCTVYHPNTGAASQADCWYATSGTIPNAEAALGVTSINASESGIYALQMASGTSTAQIIGFAEWVADTGW